MSLVSQQKHKSVCITSLNIDIVNRMQSMIDKDPNKYLFDKLLVKYVVGPASVYILNTQSTNAYSFNICLRRLYCLGNSNNKAQCDVLIIIGYQATHSVKVFADRCLRKQLADKVIFVKCALKLENTFVNEETFWNWYFIGKLSDRLTCKNYSTVVCNHFKNIPQLLQFLQLIPTNV